jgi:hypothetical protein
MSGDPSFITSKAPPGAKSDKKLMGMPILLETWRIEMMPGTLPRRKAVLKTRAVQTLRDRRTSSNCAKRLECGAFTAALDLADEAGESFAVSLKMRATGFATAFIYSYLSDSIGSRFAAL